MKISLKQSSTSLLKVNNHLSSVLALQLIAKRIRKKNQITGERDSNTLSKHFRITS